MEVETLLCGRSLQPQVFIKRQATKPEPDKDDSGGRQPETAKLAGDRYIPGAADAPGIAVYGPQAARPDSGKEGLRRCTCGSCRQCRAGLTNSETAHGAAPQSLRLSASEQRRLEELRRIDAEVRAHEQAHVAAGARNATYEYERGPDGRMYAVGGQAEIDLAIPGGDTDTKIAQAQRARRAALAPGSPSSQDQRVASSAAQLEAEARAEKSREEREAAEDENPLLALIA